MDELFKDRFTCQLAEQNYEECYGLLNSYQCSHKMMKSLQGLIVFEMQYYNFTPASLQDPNRDHAIRDIYEEVRAGLTTSDDSFFIEILHLIQIQLKTCQIYKLLSQSDYQIPENITSLCESYLKETSECDHYDLRPFQETMVCELTSIKNLVTAFTSLSKFNFLQTIIALTKAHSSIQQWEKIFRDKKYSPISHSNSSDDYNLLYRYLVKMLHGLIGKATLYFERTLSDGNLLENEEYYNRRKVQSKCAELKIHYIALLLDKRENEVLLNWQEGGYRCKRKNSSLTSTIPDKFVPVFKHNWKPEELPNETEATLYSALQSESSTIIKANHRVSEMMYNSLDLYFHFCKVDVHVYLASAYAYASLRPKGEAKAITEFINQLCTQLRSLTPRVN